MPATRNEKNFKYPNFIPQETKKKEQIKHKISRRKEITKIRAAIHKTEPKKTIEKINETTFGFLKRFNRQILAKLIKKKKR